jgi:hypothetical protein
MHGHLIAIAAVLVAIVGPLLLGLAGLMHARRARSAAAAPSWDWKLTIRSTLLYVLAFNLTFFIQELFLVLPKAFTPGLRPTLFHNNHQWEGTHPLASLFQGTGALATVLTSAVCLWWIKRAPGASGNTRLLLIWMAYCGLFMALPQVAIGAISAGSDLGMAMTYLQLGNATRLVAAMVALAALAPIALWLTGPLLALADDPDRIATPGARTRFVFLVATLPVLFGTVLIIPFRVPREWIEVVLLPAWVAVLGVTWMQAGAWRFDGLRASGNRAGSVAKPLAAVLLLLLVFQCLLRPGIAFH